MRIDREFRDGWPTLLTAFVGVGAGAQALLFFALPHFAEAYHAAYGWTRTQISGAATLFMAGMFFTVPIAGALSDRIGLRPTLLGSIVLGCLVFALFPLAAGDTTAFFGLVLALAAAGAATNAVLYSRALASWFDKARGLAFGLMMTGAGVAAAVVPVIVTLVVTSKGISAGWWTLAALSMLAAPLCLVILKPARPVAASRARHGDEPGVTFTAAAASLAFWLVLLGTLFLSVAAAGVAFHIRLLLTDAGVSPLVAASTAGAMGLGSIAARIVAGFLVDRLHAPFVATGLCLLAAAGCIGLLQFGPAYALASVLLVSVALGAEAELIGFMCSRYFGLRAYATIYGVAYSALALGSGASPLVYGMIYDRTGSYDTALLLGMSGALAAAACYAFLGPYRFRPEETATIDQPAGGAAHGGDRDGPASSGNT